MKGSGPKFRFLLFFPLLLLVAAPASACGPFFPHYLYTPEDIAEVGSPYSYNRNFSGASPGIIFPAWRTSVLYEVYRGLSGRLPVESLSAAPVDEPADPAGWLAARKTVTETAVEIRDWAEGENYSYYQNYLADAFGTAARTLSERKPVFTPEELKLWLAGQDEVFGSAPDRLFDADLDRSISNPLLRQDREYQRAAACFYRRKYDEAEARFREIAGNPGHPWRVYAALAAGRTLIRRAGLEYELEFKKSGGGGEGDKKALAIRNEWLLKARAQLEGILKDATLRTVHPSARRLLDYIVFRLEPRERLLAAEKVLLLSEDAAEIRMNLRDFALLHGLREADFIQARGGDLSRWLLAWRPPAGGAAGARAVESYRGTKSLPWLLAALKSTGFDGAAADILEAAAGIPAGSPAFLSVRYYYFSSRVNSGAARKELARELDVFLAGLDPEKEPAAWNCFADLRLLLADDLDELLKYSLRRVVAVSDFGDIYAPFPERVRLPDRKVQAFFNQQLPLEGWVDLALRDELFTSRIRRQLRLTTFLRALLLEDSGAAAEIGLILSRSDPEFKAALAPFLAARTAAQKRFEAALFILRHPRLNTVLDPASDEIIVNNLPVDRRDAYRRNWWEAGDLFGGYRDNATYALPNPAAYLPETSLKKAEAENRILRAIVAPNYLAGLVTRYAGENPPEARVAEALHLAVNATRYAAFKDEATSRYSRAAFTILHKQYPRSPWAARTPYWY